ncbi:VOC family protein [Salinicoccus albus]|uniref:VOC family protein n=1 Tax=Salinicoccus albus TaxID=418756 RepID=UPI00035E7D32|nr:VOC family protein [Salinicoccus albus]
MVKFDHIIHYVKDLQDTKSSSLLPVHSGGRHQRFGTANLLSYLDDRYIEFLSIEDEAVFKQHLDDEKDSFAKTIDTLGYEEGFIRYALSTDDIAQLAERFKEKGFCTIGPISMERTTDGEKISWQLLYVPGDEVIFPFFIQWDEAAEKRVERIRHLRGDFIHPRPKLNIHHEVRNREQWEAFYDVLGIWNGEIDAHTSVTFTENEKPSLILELDMNGESAIYKGAVYKFI